MGCCLLWGCLLSHLVAVPLLEAPLLWQQQYVPPPPAATALLFLVAEVEAGEVEVEPFGGFHTHSTLHDSPPPFLLAQREC
jgi:hypothetical protein